MAKSRQKPTPSPRSASKPEVYEEKCTPSPITAMPQRYGWTISRVGQKRVFCRNIVGASRLLGWGVISFHKPRVSMQNGNSTWAFGDFWPYMVTRHLRPQNTVADISKTPSEFTVYISPLWTPGDHPDMPTRGSHIYMYGILTLTS